MALNKYKIGDLITIVDEKNSKNLPLPFYGININKEFMPTMATTDGLDGSKYKIMTKGRFVFSGMQTGRDMCLRIGLYDLEFDSLISPAYTTFEITNPVILPEYLFMIFLSKEMDRRCAFMTDSSVRANLDWNVFCGMELELPSLEIQQKYVNVYKAMIANQKAYEKGLDDLKLVCDAYIEDLRRKHPCEKIGPYIEERDERNTDKKLIVADVKSVNKDGSFAETVAKVDASRIHTYKIVMPNDFAYTNRINIGSIARRMSNSGACLVSASYDVFYIADTNKILPEYLTLWLRRNEFFRSTGFYSVGSVKDNFDVDMMKQVAIPLPPVDIQKSIAAIYEVYLKRKEIGIKLKAQIKDICPVLIAGAIKEAKEEES